MTVEPMTLGVQFGTAQAGSPSLMRRVNAGLVLKALQSRGPLSRPELALATGLSQPTVNEIVAMLLAGRLALETASDPRQRPVRRGPKAAVLSFNAAAGHVLGVDLGAEKLVVLVSDLSGRVIARERQDVGPREALRPAPLLRQLHDAIDRALALARVSRGRLMAVGVGLPGIIDPASGRVSMVPALPGWEGIEIVSRLQAGFSCPVLVNTDVHLASLAESRIGTAKGDGDAVYVHLGVGIGIGLLISGKVYPGTDGAAGQIGNLPIGDPKDPPEAGFGMFEWSSGSSAFSRLGQRAARGRHGAKLSEAVDGNLESIGPRTILEVAQQGDREAKRILAQLTERLAQGLAAVICMFNPASLILGGEVSQLGPALIEPLRAGVASLVPRLPRHFILSSLGDDAVALGAVQVGVQTAEDKIFSTASSRAA
jgi:predicted NBD/HSP70 family sugar kinase